MSRDEFAAVEHESTLANLVSYVVISKARKKLEVKAAWPVYELINFKNKYCDEKRKGIARLAAEREDVINIGDILEHKKNNTEEGREYIEFKQETRSQLSVPILYDEVNDGSNRVIGVITLEHSQPYAFSKLHEKVITHFARQVAIAFQNKNLFDHINNNNKILASLHESLGKIVQESPQTMLYRAVLQTREALGAKEVVVIPCKKIKEKEILLRDESVPIVNGELIDLLEETSRRVYRELNQQSFLDTCLDQVSRNKFNELGFSHGLCLPFSSKSNAIGVMWILFSSLVDPKLIRKEERIYNIYVNQIALAYANSKQYEELKKKSNEDLSKEIKNDRGNARFQANVCFGISLITSVFGLLLIFGGVTQLLKSDSKNPVNGGGIAAGLGVLLQGVTILAFDRGKAANKRLDDYHKELYAVGQLSILLSATEQLDPTIVQEEKQKIIQTTTNHWLQSTNELRSNGELNVGKNTDK